jgi:hypothetical protein
MSKSLSAVLVVVMMEDADIRTEAKASEGDT